MAITRTTEIQEPNPVRTTTELPAAEENYQYETPATERPVMMTGDYDKDTQERAKQARREQFNIDRAAAKARREAAQETRRQEQEELARKQEEIRRIALEKKAEEADKEARRKTEREDKEIDNDFAAAVKRQNAERDDAKKEAKELKKMADRDEQEKLKSANKLDILKEKNRSKLELLKARLGKQPLKPTKPTRGTFHEPRKATFVDPFARASGGKGGGFPGIDPFGGMGGSGKNMLNFGNFGNVVPSKQQPKRGPAGKFAAKPRPDINSAFGNPFDGIIAASPKKSAKPAKTPNIMQGIQIDKILGTKSPSRKNTRKKKGLFGF